MQPLGILEYPWGTVDFDYVTDLPKSGMDGYTSVFIMVCHLTKMANFVPCHKEITAEESTYMFIDHCYRLHGVPMVILSDKDPKLAGKFWQTFYGKVKHQVKHDYCSTSLY